MSLDENPGLEEQSVANRQWNRFYLGFQVYLLKKMGATQYSFNILPHMPGSAQHLFCEKQWGAFL